MCVFVALFSRTSEYSNTVCKSFYTGLFLSYHNAFESQWFLYVHVNFAMYIGAYEDQRMPSGISSQALCVSLYFLILLSYFIYLIPKGSPSQFPLPEIIAPSPCSRYL